MNARAQAQCTPTCALYRSPMSAENTTGLLRPFCVPFPGGIPDDIWENRFDHRKVHPDQVGTSVWTSKNGQAFPTYALQVPETLTAAADVTEGAMIALVPSEADIMRLAVQGGEPPEQLHLTLLYLGDNAEMLDFDRERLLSWAGTFAPGWDPIGAEAFAPALFNPTGPEPCAVMLCSGADLAELYETVLADTSEIVDLPPDLHAPWIPHITLEYLTPGNNFGQVDNATVRVGPMTFDRLRLAFGGEVTDFPLGSVASTEVAPAEGLPVPEPAPPAAAVEPQAQTAAVEPQAQTAAVAGPIREVWDGPLS